MAGRITRRTVDALKPGQIAWDSELRGFGCRRVKDRPTYFVKFRVGHGRGARQRWLSIGAHSEALPPEKARREAKAIIGQAQRGEDPAAGRDASKVALTVRELAARFLKEHAEGKRKASTAAEYRRLLEQFALPAFGSMRTDAVTRADVARLHQDMASTPRQANAVLSRLSKMFNWGEARGYRPDGTNPCRHVERYHENKRERFLSHDELARLGAALGQLEASPQGNTAVAAVAAVRLLALTGARVSEILTLKWDYVDERHRCLRLPDSKTGAKLIYLNPPTLALLQRLPRATANPYVIPGGVPGSHLVNIKKHWLQISRSAGLENVRLHDLRHSFASVAAAGGHSLHIIGKLLGHTQAATTARYAHIANDPVRAAGEAVANQIAAAMSGHGGDVVAMKARAKPHGM